MRDEFSPKTKDTLFKRAGARCSNPYCRKATCGPHTDADRTVNIGVAAHITAAENGGPRYDGNLSSDERKSIKNGIWLCQDCAKLIDSDEKRYSIDIIKQWKEFSETDALSSIENPKYGIKTKDNEGDKQTQNLVKETGASIKEHFDKKINELTSFMNSGQGAIVTYPANKGYFLLNVPRTLKNNVMIWWVHDSQGYTDDLRRARIFTEKEVAEKMKGMNSDKKFAAIPINKIAVKFGQSVVPFIEKFTDIIFKNRDYVIGNKNIYLTEDEIALII